MPDSDGAAAFFNSVNSNDAARIRDAIQASEMAFEETCVRRLLRFFSLDLSLKMIAEENGAERVHLSHLARSLPRFPVSLFARRLRGRKAGSDAKRTKADLGFFEIPHNVLFAGKELGKTQVLREWENVAESAPHGPCGLVFQNVNTPFVIHSWGDAPATSGSIRLEWNRVDYGDPDAVLPKLIIQPFDGLLESVREFGWSSNR